MLFRIAKRFIKSELKISIVGKPNVGKSTFFNQFANISSRNDKLENDSLIHPSPGLTRDCRSAKIKGILSIPIEFEDTPGIDYILDKVKIKEENLTRIGKLFNWDELIESNIEELVTKNLESLYSKNSYLKLFFNLKKKVPKEFKSMLSYYLSPEKPLSDYTETIIFKKQKLSSSSNLSNFALSKMLENVSESIISSDIIIQIVNGKEELDSWDLLVSNWIKFIIARQYIENSDINE